MWIRREHRSRCSPAEPSPLAGLEAGSRRGLVGSIRWVCLASHAGPDRSRGLMRHARTSVAPAPSAAPEPTAVAAEPWTWPEAPGLPPQPRDDGPWTTAEQVVPLAALLEPTRTAVPPIATAPAVVQPQALPAADRPPRRGRRARAAGGPSAAERYGAVESLPPVAEAPAAAGHRGSPSTGVLRGPLAGLVAALLGVAVWGALVSVTDSAMAFFAVVIGLLVGASTRLVGGPSSDANVFCVVVWSIVGACAGLLVSAVLLEMSRLGVGAAEAIAGPRWNDIVTSVASNPLNGVFVVAAAALAVVLVRR